MSNFTNSQKSRTTHTSWRSESESVGSRPHNPLQEITSSSTADYYNTANISNNLHLDRTNPTQRTGSVTTSTTSSSFASSNGDTTVHNSRQRNPLAQPRPYFAPNSVAGYLWPNKDQCNSNNYRQRNDQRMSNTWLRDSSQSSRGSNSSTESGIFSGDSCAGDIKPVYSSNDRNNHLNCPPNHRNSRGFNRYPPGMPRPTPASHFASSNSFNAPAASSLPQPPQSWLFSRAEALVKEEDLKEERALEKKSNTFDYYNLKMLLTVEA
ncbi:hybrid signal transduction histidine kinase M-like [Zeugodacus cucurbitae]|uniref:hybrid signal transduction histidine kinase M-like n=1 Tax=Zeugodacus cucurbitae TaxID=28588 RepID=UPI0023D96DA8|nr:hybrid signal transduction histidine kinase M-like [Zeugodacus cucurbitae]